MLGRIKEMFGLKNRKEILVSPVEGNIIPVTEVSDPTFGEEIVGKGIAIEPTNGKVMSPVNGIVSMLFETKHAVIITSEQGAEILIHIGLDTVKLKGEFFTAFVTVGQKVKTGDLLVEFNLEELIKAGYDSVTPMVICNMDKYRDIKIKTGSYQKVLSEVITLFPLGLESRDSN